MIHQFKAKLAFADYSKGITDFTYIVIMTRLVIQRFEVLYIMNLEYNLAFVIAKPEPKICTYKEPRARILKLLRSPRIDSKESIPPAYVARQAGTTILLLLGS